MKRSYYFLAVFFRPLIMAKKLKMEPPKKGDEKIKAICGIQAEAKGRGEGVKRNVYLFCGEF